MSDRTTGFRISPQQRRLWAQRKESRWRFESQLGIQIEGALTPDALRRAVCDVVQRHDTLRTFFPLSSGVRFPLQVLGEAGAVDWRQIDLMAVADGGSQELEALFRSCAKADEVDVEKPWKLPVLLARIEADHHLLILRVPALCADSRSLDTLLLDIAQAYRIATKGGAAEWEEPVQYSQFSEWLLEEGLGADGSDFWDSLPPMADFQLPEANPTGSHIAAPAQLQRAMDGALRASLEETARNLGVNLGELLLAAWLSLLFKLSGTGELVVQTLFDGRPFEELEGACGLFARYLPVSVTATGETSFPRLLRRVVRQLEALGEYQDRHPGILQDSDIPGVLPLAFEFQDSDPQVEVGEVRFTAYRRQAWIDRVALKLGCRPQGEGLGLELLYDPARYGAGDGERLLGRWCHLLQALVKDPRQSIDALDAADEQDQRRLAALAPEQPSGLAALYSERFAAAVAETPDAPAVEAGDTTLSYGELALRVHALALDLRGRGVGPEVLVGLCAERSIAMLVGMLAILEAGGAFLPLTPSLPRERIEFLVKDSGARLLLVDEPWNDIFAEDAPVVPLVTDKEAAAGPPPVAASGPDNLAYVLYTSGSTGRPKGVAVSHSNLDSYLRWSARTYGADCGDGGGVVVHSPFSFDLTMTTLLGPLTVGGWVRLIPTQTELDSLAKELSGDQPLTLVKLTPAHLEVLQRMLPEQAAGAEVMVLGGEALYRESLEAWRQRVPRGRIFNEYGPTEATVGCCVYEVSEELPAGQAIPIGRPIDGVRLYVADRHGNLALPGIAGELLIGGECVTRGYLGRPAITAESFVPDPYSSQPGARLYRSGDEVRLRQDGELEFLGRLDHQIKIRGFRIEPGEIEHALLEYPAVREAVVMAQEDVQTGVRLVAYVVLEDGEDVVEAPLRDHCAQVLPEYMVPAYIVPVLAFPLTQNGKIDRAALSEFEASLTSGSARPRNPMEEMVAGIWCDVLGRSELGIHDDFFDLGGHSLLATQVISRVRQSLGISLPVSRMFGAPTVAGLAAVLQGVMRGGEAVEMPPIEPVSRDQQLPLSFAQERLWFLDQYEPGRSWYNIPAAVRLRGGLCLKAFEGAFNALVERHESLRTQFVESTAQPVQRIQTGVIIPISLVDLRGLDPQQRENVSRALAREEAADPFDLARGPLLRCVVLEHDEEEHTILLTLHHIISDAWSAEILVRELATLYQAAREGRSASLPLLPVQYADYAVWQRRLLQGETLDAGLEYWRQRLEGSPQVIPLALDRPRPRVSSYSGDQWLSVIPDEQTAELKALSRTQGMTLFMVLLAAFQLLLSRSGGGRDIVVGSPIAGRNRVEIEGLIGFFVNTLALRSDLSGNPTVQDFLAQVREVSLGAYAHQELPFERLVEELQPVRSPSYSPLVQVVFQLQNTPASVGGETTLDLQLLNLGGMPAKFDILLGLEEWEGRLHGAWNFNTDLFDRTTVARLDRQLLTLLGHLTSSLEKPLRELSLLAPEERHQLLLEWPQVRTAAPAEPVLTEWFRQQAEASPDALALLSFSDTGRDGEELGEAQPMTYGQLASRAGALAGYLVAQGLERGDRVALYLDRSSWQVVAILGVLQAGGVYVPLEPTAPAVRVEGILAECGASLVLTQHHRQHALTDLLPQEGRVVALDREWPAIESFPPARAALTGSDSAYVIYTSGSTGRPKGVVIPHGNVARLFTAAELHYDFGPEDVWTLFHSYAFDFSVWEIWGALLYGGRLVVVPYWVSRSPDFFRALLVQERVTILNQTPSAFRQLIAADAETEADDLALRWVIFGGEALDFRSLEPWFAAHGETSPTLVNMYGITETTVHVTHRRVRASDAALASSPIGRSLTDLELYLLDEERHPVPVGVAGELYVGGAGLAQGYLGRSGLTAERFVPNPFGGEPGARLYRTGDQGRWLIDGGVEYLGRLDRQVKIRGFRIELGEIEAVLEEHPEIRRAVARLQIEGDREDARLVAYVEGPESLRHDGGLVEQARARLPEYMVPSTMVTVESFPLTANGKIDFKALEALELEQRHPSERYVAPRKPLEELLCQIWSELLGVERVSIEDDFFELGGHSLLATQVASRVRENLHIPMPVAQLFATPTVGELASFLEEMVRGGAVPQIPPVLPVERGDSMPLSFAQERLWFLDQYEPGRAWYNIPAAVRFRGGLCVPAFERALNRVLGRHEVLRTHFINESGKPRQVVKARCELRVSVVNLRGLEPRIRGHHSRQLARREAALAFDLRVAPLVRCSVLDLGEEEHIILLTLHHIISDAWSAEILLRELVAFYQADLEDRTASLPPLPVQYADYAAWQRLVLQGKIFDAELEYWRRRLEGVPPVIALATDRPRPQVSNFAGDQWFSQMPADLTASVHALSRAEGMTPFMVLLATFQALLSHTGGSRDIVVGSPIAGRNRVEIEGLIGFFVNTLALRTDLSGNPTVQDFLARVREVSLGAYAHQELPFERLVEELQPARSPSYSPLVQVVFHLENTPPSVSGGPSLDIALLNLDGMPAKFDIVLGVEEQEERFLVTWNFNTDLFDRTTVARLDRQLLTLLGHLTSSVEKPLWELSLLTPEERHQLLLEWPQVRAAAPAEPVLTEWFRRQAEAAPDALALLSFSDTGRDGEELGEAQPMTYGQLASRAGALAGYLVAQGLDRGDRVALYLDRSSWQVVAILGVLQAGGVYVPLEPTAPGARVEGILAECGASLVLTQHHRQHALTDLLPKKGRVVALDREWPAIESFPPARVALSGSDSAYVIYTSGSTGRPKGVVIPHGNVARLLTAAEPHYDFGPEDVWTLFHSYAFDFSVWEIWGALLYGGRLVVVPYWVSRSPDFFRALLVQERVTVLNQTPSAFRQLIAADAETEADDLALRWVIFGGEALDFRSLEPWFAAHGETSPTLVNMYGITETTVHVTHRRVRAFDAALTSSPIGRSLTDLELYLLDEERHPVPVGVAGELYVGGAGLAQGYLGRSGLTAERFVPNPFGGEPGARLYRTGDQGRWLIDGGVEYLGRLDRQVKIRGFRIELGEIEAVLEEHPEIRRAVARLQIEGGREDSRLVAYVEGPESLRHNGGLVEQARARLPEYMVPSMMVTVESFPLTANGKIDFKALEALELEQSRPSERYVAPRKPLEELLCQIWSELLGVERVSIEDDFFELGGHSLLVTQLIARVRQHLHLELPVRTVFQCPTVAALAEALAEAPSDDAPLPPLETVDRDRPLPLSYAQQRLWFLDQMESGPGRGAYTVPLHIRLSGAVELEHLNRSLAGVVERHEILRTTFPEHEGEPVQHIAPASPLTLPVVDLSGLESERRRQLLRTLAMRQVEQPFHLAEGPLLRVAVVRLAEEDHGLLLTLPHILTDGWSTGVLWNEVVAFYRAYQTGESPSLPALPVQYADYAAWQRQWLEGGAQARQMKYWSRRLAGLKPLDLPTDRPRPAVQTSNGAELPWRWEGESAERLMALGLREGLTPFMILLSSLGIVLSRYTSQDDLSIGTPVANRRQAEFEPLIGFFVNTLVLRIDLSGDPTFRQLAQRVREATLEAYDHQDVPFERLVDGVAPERDTSRQALFQVMFALQNVPRSAVMVEGLRWSVLGSERQTANFDLTLALAEMEGGFQGGIEYNTDLFDPSRIERLARHLRGLLMALVEGPDRKLSEIPMLLPAEQHQVLVEWSGQPPQRSTEHWVCQRFAAHAARRPDTPAVIWEKGELSYGDLEARVHRLAWRLRSRGVERGEVVALFLERGPEMIVALLAVLKAGAAYLPIDPRVPAARLAYYLRDAQVSRVVSRGEAGERLLRHLAESADVDPDVVWMMDSDTESGDDRDPGIEVSGQDLAYVIYTSGSSGEPKGVMISHQALADFTTSATELMQLTPEDRVMQFASISFDASIEEIFPTLTSGAALVLRPEGMLEPATLVKACREWGVTLLDLPTAYWQTLVADLEVVGGLPESVRRVLIGGEAAQVRTVTAWHERVAASVELINTYGPTEATVVVTAGILADTADRETAVSIGRPRPNTAVYVVNRHQRPVALGTPGELVLGGSGLARGYLGRPAQTALRFIPDPFSGEMGSRLYRSGDLVRSRNDGELIFLGRLDQQIKIRGHRIEPGEVEATLLSHPAITQTAVVLWRTPGGEDPRLVAYLVGSEPEVTADSLRGFLGQRLPSPLIPAKFIILDSLPMTISGKVDRKNLPDPEWQGEREFVAPRTPEEELLAQHWAHVLGLEAVSVEDSFFDLGGHSLLATRVVSRVRELFQVELRMRDFFEAPTVRELAAVISHAARRDFLPPSPPVVAVPRREDLPLSFAQQRLWFLDQLSPGSSAYNLPASARLRGRIQVAALEAALGTVVQRHEALRTTLPTVDGQAVQRIEEPSPRLLPVVDFSGLDEGIRVQTALSWASSWTWRPFELDRGPLLRVILLRLGEQDHILNLVMHHTVGDGWSFGLLSHELSVHYEAEREGRPSPLEPQEIQYADYAVWEREWLQGEVLEAELSFWQQHLGGELPVLELPTDRPRSVDMDPRAAVHYFLLEGGVREGLEALSREHDTTPFMTALAAVKILLAHNTGQRDLLVGTPVAGRNRSEVEGVIGFFANTLVLRTDLGKEATVADVLQGVREVALGAFSHQGLPFEKLVDEFQPQRRLDQTPLFQLMFLWQDLPEVPVNLAGVRAEEINFPSEIAKFDLLISLTETETGIAGAVEYRRALFDATTIQRFGRHLGAVTAGMAAAPEGRITEISLLSPAERHQAVVEWNDTRGPQPSRVCLHQPFEDQVVARPNHQAVIADGEVWSYRELEDRANRLAHHLRSLGVRPGVLVAIFMERSAAMVEGLLGIVKAGGAYVPLDLSYPPARVEQLIESLSVAHIVTAGAGPLATLREMKGAFSLRHVVHLTVGETSPEVASSVGAGRRLWTVNDLAVQPSDRPEPLAQPDDLAYIIFTSGSTGTPKGVMVRHQPAINLIEWVNSTFEVDPSDRILFVTSLSFDLSVYDVFGILAAGATVRVASAAEIQDPEILVRVMYSEPITLWDTAPAALQRLVVALPDGPPPPSRLRLVLQSGDWIPLTLPDQVRQAFPAAEFVSLGGATEATIWSNFHRVGEIDPHWVSIPYGRPIRNARYHVVNEVLEPSPIGVPGDLLIGGDVLYSGYSADARLNALKNPPDPFSLADPGARLYRTGDRARVRSDGEIEFLGRVDFQVKIRGYRIELGEIEATLTDHPMVQQAVALAREDRPGDKRLVAYVVCRDETPSTSELRNFAAERLSEYMIPSAFVPLDSFPVTANGKLDRRALPAPTEERPELENAFAAPEGERETALAAIWSTLLAVEQVGRHDNFFELGGDSILSIQVVARARQQGMSLGPRDVFERQTIAELARATAVAVDLPVQAPVVGVVSLSPPQRWFLERSPEDPHHFNQTVLLEVVEALEEEPLRAALNALLEHHDALRARFQKSEEGWRQEFAATGELSFEVVDLAAHTDPSRALASVAADTQAGLYLNGPLMAARLFEMGQDEPQRLLLVIHHLVVDGVSWRILLEDLLLAYRQAKSGETLSLPPRTTSMKAWVSSLEALVQDPELNDELDGWWARGRQEVQPLPQDRRGENTVGSTRSLSIALSLEETHALLRNVPQAYRTSIEEVLLTALAQAFSPWTGEEHLLVDLEGHGRRELAPGHDYTRTVGWFTTFYPVLLERAGASGEPGEDLKAIKEQLRRIPRHGLGYSVLRYLRPETAERLRAMPPAQVLFNYFGQLDRALPADSPFRPAREATGATQSPRQQRKHLLELNASIAGERLGVQWTYSTEIHDQATVTRLSQAYLDALQTLIEHCCTPGVFGHTPSDFPLAALDQSAIDQLVAEEGPLEDLYPLAPLQHGLLFQTLTADQADTYLIQQEVVLEGPLDAKVFQRTWQWVVDRHPSMRTGFVWDRLEQPLQWVRPIVEVPFESLDWSSEATEVQDRRWQDLVRADRERGISIETPPLIRLTLVRTEEDCHRFLWSHHHLVLDGWSMPLLLQELLVCYRSLIRGRQPNLPEPRPFRDYIAWIASHKSGAAEAFWRGSLEGFTEPTALPVEAQPDAVARGTEAVVSVHLSAAETRRLETWARKHQLTLNTLVQGVWGLILGHRAGRREAIFGAVTSGRPPELDGVETMVGNLINTLPVRVSLPADTALVTWLRRLQDQQAEARQYQYVGLHQLQRWSSMEAGRALFNTLIVFENYPVDPVADGVEGELRIREVSGAVREAYPLSIQVVATDRLEMDFKYDPGMLSGKDLERLAAVTTNLLQQLDTAPLRRLEDLQGLLEELFREQRAEVQRVREAKRVGQLRGLRRRRATTVSPQRESDDD